MFRNFGRNPGWLIPLFLCGLIWMSCSRGTLTPSAEFGAYYTKINSGEEFERYSRTGDHPDIIVDLGTDNGKFIFWRASSYLPYWETSGGKWYVDELVPRSGDGPPQRPDKVNTYSVVKIIENTPRKVVIHWRYLPEFSGTNPHLNVDATKFVDEYFTIYPDGNVTRTIRKGTEKIDDWNDRSNISTQTFSLTADGLTDKQLKEGSPSGKVAIAKGSPVKTGVVGEPTAWWKFDEARGDEAVESVSDVPITIVGHKSLWRKGVSGTALQFDGYNTLIRLPAGQGA